MFSFVWASVWLIWLILWDDSAVKRVYQNLPELWGSNDQLQWPGDKGPLFWESWPGGDFFRVIWDFIFLDNRIALRDSFQFSMPVPFQPAKENGDGHLDWPQDFQNVPLPFNGTWIFQWEDPEWMPGWIRRIYPYDGHLNIPSITAEYVIPILAMTLLPALMIFILFKLGWAHTTRDVMISLFTGFILVYFGLTIIGVAFRGKGQNLVPFWKVPNLEKDPTIQRHVPPPESQFVLIDTRTGIPIHG
jgi:hypothetical protein